MNPGRLRTRAIRPQTIDNERIAALGPFGVLLMITLPMLADRDGLLEYRPDYIRAKCLPYFPDAGVVELLEAVEKLGEISTYTCGETRYIHVSRFQVQQHVHPEERRSTLPAPAHFHRLKPRKRSRNRACTPVLQNDQKTQVGSPSLSTTTEKYYGVAGGSGGIEQEGSPPPMIPENPETRKPAEADSGPEPFWQAELFDAPTPRPIPPKPMPSPNPTRPIPRPTPPHVEPETEPVAKAAIPAPTRPVARPETPRSGNRNPPKPPTPRKPPVRECCSSSGTVNWWPYTDADIVAVRDSLTALARQLNMPPPDDGIVRNVLDKGHGATGDGIHCALVDAYKRRKFASMKSWGLVPIVVGGYFRVA